MRPISDISTLMQLLRDGKASEAIPQLEYLAHRTPAHVAVHALLAQAYTMEGRLDEARYAWQDASFLMPNSPAIQAGFRHVLKEIARTQASAQFEVSSPVSIDEGSQEQDMLEDAPPDEHTLAEAEGHELEGSTNEVSEVDAESVSNDALAPALDTPELTVNAFFDPIKETIESGATKIDKEAIGEAPEGIDKETIGEGQEAIAASTSSIKDIFASSQQPQADPSGDAADAPAVHAPSPSSPEITTVGSVNDLLVPPSLAPITENNEWKEDEELDHLIEELETARIIPKPDHEHIEMPELDDNIEDMVSETLAQIYAGQQQYDQAATMYDKLAALQPDRAEEFEQRATEMRSIAPNDTTASNIADEAEQTHTDDS